jgi:hypothetical protein
LKYLFSFYETFLLYPRFILKRLFHREECEMKKFFLVAILFLFFLVPTASMARTDFFVNIGLGLPLPVLVAPAPVFVAPAPPVVVAPAPVIVAPPVYVQPGPVIYGPPGWYHGRKRGWYKYRW